MATKLLLPHKYKSTGWLLLFPAIVGLILLIHFNMDPFPFLTFNKTVWLGMENDTFTDELYSVEFLVGLLLIAFSAESLEDERVTRLRLEAFQWAVLANSIILLLAIVLIYDFKFFFVMEYNMFSTLIFFIIRFHYLILRDDSIVEA
jgi:hypothetical protein